MDDSESSRVAGAPDVQAPVTAAVPPVVQDDDAADDVGPRAETLGPQPPLTRGIDLAGGGGSPSGGPS